MSRSINKYGGGSQTNYYGLQFEQSTSLNDALINAGYKIINKYEVYYNEKFLGFSINQARFSTVFLRNKGIDYRRYNSKRLDKYEEFAKDMSAVKNKLNQFKNGSLKSPGKLIIKEFPTSSAGANDIELYLRKEEERLGFKFDEVYVDYMSIMKNSKMPNSENTYLKLKTITDKDFEEE